MRISTFTSSARCSNAGLLRIVIVLQIIAFLTSVHDANSEKIRSNGLMAPERPQLVRDALEKGKPLYYFGLGSNMSRKKIENRGLNGTKIEIKKMEAAVVPNYRLAFNMRGFPPIEPGMGSLEPVDSGAKALLKYESGECHGALVKLSPTNYEKVMRSEGVGQGRGDQGYEEIVVEAYPYGRKQPVKAVALRARDHVRLNFDPCPSARYMSILREGAEELGLRPCYQDFLKRIPVEMVKGWQRKQAIFNIFFMFSLSSVLNWRGLTQLQSRMLFLFYAPESQGKLRKLLSVGMTTLILLPGSIMGLTLYYTMELLGKTPQSAKRMFDLLDKDKK